MTHASGEKCATQLFTEMHVGNASPARWGERKTKRKREIKINQFDRQLGFWCRDRAQREPLGTLTPLTDLLYTAPVPSSMSLSPSTQRPRIFAPSTDSSTSLFTAALTMSAAAYHHADAKIRKKKNPDGRGRNPPTLYLVISASAVDRGFSVAAGGDAVLSESDII